MKLKLKILFAIFATLSLTCGQVEDVKNIYVANWNVQNLFDTVDDTGKRDEDFTPAGKLQWTEERLEIKIEHLTQIIGDMNYGNGPDIIAFEEVEHQALLKKIGEKLNGHNYKFVYFESPDKRGIDNGIMYDANKLNVLRTEALHVDLPSDYPTRDIVYAEFKITGAGTLHFFANHWPSRRGGLEQSEPNRIAAARVLKNKIDEILKAQPSANIIITGDFNDEPVNKSINKVLGAGRFNCDSLPDSELFNLAYYMDTRELGTYMYRGNFNMLDQIIISRGLKDNIGLEYECGSFEIIKPEYAIQKSGKYKGAILPTYGGRTYLNGYSDHFPVGAKFIIK